MSEDFDVLVWCVRLSMFLIGTSLLQSAGFKPDAIIGIVLIAVSYRTGGKK